MENHNESNNNNNNNPVGAESNSENDQNVQPETGEVNNNHDNSSINVNNENENANTSDHQAGTNGTTDEIVEKADETAETQPVSTEVTQLEQSGENQGDGNHADQLNEAAKNDYIASGAETSQPGESAPVTTETQSENPPEVQPEESKGEEADVVDMQKVENLLVLREGAETENLEETNPHLRRIAAITLSNSIRKDPECADLSVRSEGIINLFDKLKREFAEGLDKVNENQKLLFGYIGRIKSTLDILTMQVNTKFLKFVKVKRSDRDARIKDLRTLEDQSQKAKYYLQMLNKRLQDVEMNIDKLIHEKTRQGIPPTVQEIRNLNIA